MGQVEQSLYIPGIARYAGGLSRNSPVAGNAKDLRNTGGLPQLPDQSVLPATVADNQYLHIFQVFEDKSKRHHCARRRRRCWYLICQTLKSEAEYLKKHDIEIFREITVLQAGHGL